MMIRYNYLPHLIWLEFVLKHFKQNENSVFAQPHIKLVMKKIKYSLSSQNKIFTNYFKHFRANLVDVGNTLQCIDSTYQHIESLYIIITDCEIFFTI